MLFDLPVIEGLLSSDEVKLISDTYMKAPDYEPYLSHDYKVEFSSFVRNVMLDELDIARQNYSRDFKVSFVDAQPYNDANVMRDDVRSNGHIAISTQYNNSPLMAGNVNLWFRLAHDLHHSRTLDCNFHLDGELCAFTKFAEYSSRVDYTNLLFCEIVGQTCAFIVAGKGKAFQVQRLVAMPEFLVKRVISAYR